MPFPKSERIVYERNPLEAVICQLRFPTILRIESTPPVEFQESVRSSFPHFREELVGPLISEEVAKLVNVQALARVSYEFRSEDEAWKLNLGREAIALTNTEYRRWEDFRSQLTAPVDALVRAYSPSFLSRIGLRYRNVIQRSVLGLDECAWKTLLQTHVVAELGNDQLGSAIVEATKALVVKLPEHNARVRVLHGIQAGDGEQVYFIDSDFFVAQKTGVEDVWNRLEYFHQSAHQLFRSFISDKLHEAMGPRPL